MLEAGVLGDVVLTEIAVNVKFIGIKMPLSFEVYFFALSICEVAIFEAL